jgi:hypothetical protein
MPSNRIFFMRIWWLIISNALLKSNRKTRTVSKADQKVDGYLQNGKIAGILEWNLIKLSNLK